MTPMDVEGVVQTVPPWVWIKLLRYPGYVRHSTGRTETVEYVERGMRFSAPMEWVEAAPVEVVRVVTAFKLESVTPDGCLASEILESETVEPVPGFDLPAWLRERIATDGGLEPLGDVVTELEQIVVECGDPDASDHAEAALGRMALVWVSVEEFERLMGWAG